MSCLLAVRQTELAARLGAQDIHGDGADLYALLLAQEAAAWPYVSILTRTFIQGLKKLGAAFKRALS